MDARRRFEENPFYVLGLGPGASRAEVERAAQKLLAELELGLSAAASCATPLGPRRRDAEAVRAAAASLREPRTRAWHELWAAAPLAPPAAPDAAEEEPPSALRALGWRR